MARDGNGELLHREITGKILDAFYQVHHELGFGFIEPIYSKALARVMVELGLHVEREVPIDVYFRGTRLGRFKADLVVESAVIVELKARATLDPSASAQLINYLRATEIEVGLLLHFGQKARFERFVFANSRKLLPRRSA